MERPRHGSAENLSSREPVNGQPQVGVRANAQCTQAARLMICAAYELNAEGSWRCSADMTRHAQIWARCDQDPPVGCHRDGLVQVKRKAEAMDGDVKAELSDDGPPLKQTKSMGALKIKLKMPRPSQQP